MSRTIVEVTSNLVGDLEVRLVEFDADIPDALRAAHIDCDPDDMPPWSSAAAVTAHGRKLRDALAGHPAIDRALDALSLTPAGQRRPLYFALAVADAERFSWEALVDDADKFLALDPRTPVARIAASAVGAAALPRDFAPPLRMAAVLSARGIEAVAEWEALWAAVRDARIAGLPSRLAVWVGERPLLDELRDGIANGELPEVEVDTVPATWPELEAQLDAYDPHLLHFFCHGFSDAGVRELIFGTLAPDVDLHAAIEIMAQARSVRGAWLVALNCCEGGRPAEELPSMAHRLVTAGSAAAIGMLEPIDASDAHRLAEVLYPVVLDRVRRALATIGVGAAAADDAPEAAIIEWASTLQGPRAALIAVPGRSATDDRTWTRPVLYVRREGLSIRGGRPLTPDQRAMVQLVRGLLAALPPSAGLPPEIEGWARGELQRVNLPRELWPPELESRASAGDGGDRQPDHELDDSK